MAGKRVAVLDPDGNFGTVDEADVDGLPDGARVLSSQEMAQRAVDERYDALPAWQKGLGAASTVAGVMTGNPLIVGASPDAPPTLAAYGAGVRQGMTAGLGDAAMRKGIDELGGKEKGDRFAQRRDEETEASPYATGTGHVAGMLAGAAAGSGAGAARALPSAALAMGGEAIEHATVRALGGLAARGTLGKAATTGAGMAVRGAIEGGAYAGLEQAGAAALHDTPQDGEKLYTAFGHGALEGAALGFGLGFSGSLAASGWQALRGRAATSLARGGREAVAEAPAPMEVPFIDADAGLKTGPGRAEKPISIGAERRPAFIRGQGKITAPPTEEAFSIGRTLGIDPDAGLRAPLGKVGEPLDLPAFTRDTRRGALEAAMRGEESPLGARIGEGVFDFERDMATSSRSPLRHGFDVEIDPEAGLAKRNTRGKFQGKVEAEDGLYLSSDKRKITRSVDLDMGGKLGPAEELPSPIKIPAAPEAPKRRLGLMDLLSQPEDAARALAADSAWASVGAGFGLQTTRFAKQAQKYFPNGTRDLGEVALRHGLIDVPHGSTPMDAAFQAAKSGRPEHILPKAEAALEGVGRRIGEITETSGARVDLDDLSRRIRRVRAGYDKFALNDHVVAELDRLEGGLRARLGPEGGAQARVQDVLEHRKDLDRIVYQETKTLDPKGRVAALRQVRAEMEDAISDAMDAASGRVKGELRGDYERLKKDYHALSILRDAAEDSAARASNGATFGLGEKFAIASAVASGNVTAAPILGLAGKVVRERGSAAAAAYLSRAADLGTFSQAIGRVDERVARAAKGVLKERRTTQAGGEAVTSPRALAKQAEDSQKAIAKTKKQAQSIVEWVASVRANPKRFMDRLLESSEVVGRSAGAKASTAYSAAAMKAFQFIASYVPVKERRDPLDPRRVPPLTLDEADRLVRATRYAVRPMTVWDDFDRGIVTPEGLRAANDFMPEQFGDFRMRLHSYVTEHMLRNKQLTQSQRLRIDKLLGSPAGADLKPQAIARYQQVFDAPLPDAGGPSPKPTGGGPVNMKIQQSGFDSVEARKAN